MRVQINHYQLKKAMITNGVDYIDDNGYNEIFKEEMTPDEAKLHDMLLSYYYAIVERLVNDFDLNYGYINYIILEDNELVVSVEWV